MNELTKIIKEDMVPALGVTEPGAIAFAVAKAKTYVSGNLKLITLRLNSGMYKNAFTCGIPNSDEVGNAYAASLGYLAGNSDFGLESLRSVSSKDNIEAKKLLADKKIKVELAEISSRIYIEVILETEKNTVQLKILDKHTNIIEIKLDGKIIFENKSDCSFIKEDSLDKTVIHKYKLKEILNYVNDVPIEEIEFVKEAYETNLQLFHESLNSNKTAFTKKLKEMNGGKIISNNEKDTASLLCNGTIEARVIGIEKPAMSITGSGAHGIIATMPLYAVYKINNLKEEKLYRATVLSYLICTYIKEYSGRLSAFCGCAIAAGTGMAVGVAYMKGGDEKTIEYVINNMASSLTGMICDGGNQGCVMKGIAACDTAFRSVELALSGVHIDKIHGINGNTPEDTMRYMGMIASPGMVATEKTIIDIFNEKEKY